MIGDFEQETREKNLYKCLVLSGANFWASPSNFTKSNTNLTFNWNSTDVIFHAFFSKGRTIEYAQFVDLK